MPRDLGLLAHGRRKWSLAVLVLGCGILYCVNLDTRVVLDDPWHSIGPYRLASLGSLSDPVTWPGEFARHHLLTRPAYNVVLAGVYWALGVGVEQGRLLSIVFAAITVLGTYLLAREWYDGKVARAAALLLSAHNLLFISARTVRPETMLSTAAVLTFYFYWRGRRSGSGWWWYAMAGLASGLGALAHPNMVLVIVALGVVELVEDGVSVLWRSRGPWIYGASIALVCLPFAWYVVAVDGPNQFHNFATQYMLQGRSRSLTGSAGALASLRGELGRYATYATFPYRTLQAALEVLCLVVLAVRRTSPDKRIWIVIVTSAVLFAALISNKSVRYLTVLVPFVTIAMAAAGAYLDRLRPLGRLGPVRGLDSGAALLALYFLVSVAGNVGLLVTTSGSRYYEVFAPLQSVVPADAVVYGSFVPWFLLPDNEYYGCGRHRVETTLEELEPTIIVWDEGGYCTRWTPEKEARMLRDTLHTRGTHLLRIEDAYYGTFEVYRLASAEKPRHAGDGSETRAGDSGGRP